MADIFRSKDHPSLFPMSVSAPTISNEDYVLFYKHERSLFTLLLAVLHREVVQSTLVIGFLLWLEREGYCSKNLVETILTSLSPDMIDRVANEAVICLKFLERKPKNFLFDGSNVSYDLSLLQLLLDKKKIKLDTFHRERDSIFQEVTCMAREVSERAFEDIKAELIARREPNIVMHSPVGGGVGVEAGAGAGAFRYMGHVAPFPSYDNVGNYVGLNQQMLSPLGQDVNNEGMALYMENYYQQRQRNSLVLSRMNANGHVSSSLVGDHQEEVPPENRTIFLTFSKGYPISEFEVREYFTRMFGDFIESIYMQQVEGDTQPLFARIVARSPSMVRAVVDRDGGVGKSKYYINGKHVWARKYVKRTPSSKDNGEAVASPRA